MARIMPALEFRSFHSHRSCEYVPNTARLATLAAREPEFLRLRFFRLCVFL